MKKERNSPFKTWLNARILVTNLWSFSFFQSSAFRTSFENIPPPVFVNFTFAKGLSTLLFLSKRRSAAAADSTRAIYFLSVMIKKPGQSFYYVDDNLPFRVFLVSRSAFWGTNSLSRVRKWRRSHTNTRELMNEAKEIKSERSDFYFLPPNKTAPPSF